MCLKRQGGNLVRLPNQVIWQVTSESTQKEDKCWVHSCGTELMGARVRLSHRDGFFLFSGCGEVREMVIPYCPKCEVAPKAGTFNDSGEWTIDTWETSKGTEALN